MSNLLRAIVSVVGLSVAVAATALTGIGQEQTGKVQQGLVNGGLVSPENQEYYGLLTITSPSSTCSASLLTNDWAITAAHCFTSADLGATKK